MARIAVGGFQHETNCFVPDRTDFAWFCDHRDRPPLSRGTEVLERLPGKSFALSGFLAAMAARRSEEHTSELQSLMRISYAVFCLKKKKTARDKKCNNNIE